MRTIVLYIFMVAGLLPGTRVLAQADISMSTHWYNRSGYNPASVARTDYLYFFSDIRQQWAGVKGAPQIFNVQVSDYVHDIRSAFGISLVGDKIGVTQALNAMLTYAYRIEDDHDKSLSMGLSAGVFSRSVDGSLFDAEVTEDPLITYGMERSIRPDANIGLEYKNSHFIFSLSTTHVLSFQKADSMFLNTNHRYGSVIYRNIEPELFNYNVGLQVVNRHNLTVLEGNACIRFKRQTGLVRGPQEFFELGLTYRTSRQLTVLFGLNISPNLKLGYSYNESFVKGYYQAGTHEMMLEYRIFKRSASSNQNSPKGYWYN